MIFALLLAIAPSTATVLPEGTSVLLLDGGLFPLRIGGPFPVVPIATGDIEWGHGLGPVDLRLRLTSHLGVVHRFGPEMRGPALRLGRLSVSARVHPSVQFVGAREEELEYGGDLSTLVGVVGSVWWPRPGMTTSMEAGLTVQWLVFEHLDEGSHVDDDPYLAYWELGAQVERPVSDSSSLYVRLETAIPRAPDDPFTFLGGFHRLLVGASWEI